MTELVPRLAPSPSNTGLLKIWDISPAVDERSEVFPGDTASSQQIQFSLSPDCPVNVQRITLSPHTGAHADAPLHYASGEAAIGAVDLQPYLGLCRVVYCLERGPLVLPAHIEHALDYLPPRVLLRTVRVASHFWASFSAISPAKFELLAIKKIALIGMDTLSVDPAASQDLPCHHFRLKRGLRMLENLVPDEAPEGDCKLIALPLELTRADDPPVRAILRELP